MSMRAGVVVIVALVASLSSARAAPQAPPLPRKIVAGSSSVIHLTGHAGGIVQIDGPGGRRSFHSGDATDLVIVGGGTLSIGALDGTRVHLSARRIVLEGAVHADALELSAGELIDIRAAATIDAAAVRLRARVVINAGRVSASNAGGGAIDIVADDVANQGALAATGARGDGGAVRVRYQRQLMESVAN